MSLEESVEITLESSLHHYRTEIPNIIFEMNLDPYEFKAYCVLKMTAGDNGSCFKGTERLCQEIGCQKPKLIEIKRSLMSKGLIKITKRKHANGSMMPDLITIVDLWVINMKTWLKKYENKKGGNLGLPGVVINDYQGGNLGLPKQEHIEQEQIKQQQDSPVSAAAAVSFCGKDVQKDSPKSMQHNLYHQTKAIPYHYPILESIEIPKESKMSITRKFPEEKVNEAIKILKSKSQQPRSIAAFIQWACANDIKYEEPKKKLTAYEKVCKIFKNGEKYNNAECYLNQQVIAFERGMKNEDVKLDKYFTWEKLEQLCSLFQIPIPRTI